MTTIVDEISPTDYGENRIRLELSTQTPVPRAGLPVLLTVDASRALPDGLRFPLEFTVTSPSGSVLFHRQVFRRFLPQTLAFRPSEGGNLLFRLAELHHNRWWGALALDVSGGRVERAPIRNPPAAPAVAAAVFPSFELVKSIDFTAGQSSRVPINWLGARSIDAPLTFAGWVRTQVAGNGGSIWNAGQFGNSGWDLSTIWTGSAFDLQLTLFKSGGGLLQAAPTTPLSLPADAWVHLAHGYVGDAATLLLYANGAAVPLSYSTATVTPGGTIFHQSFDAADAGWFLGYHQATSSAFEGKLANVGIYARSFSGADALLDYNGGSPQLDRLHITTASDLLAWYPPVSTDTDPTVQLTDAGPGGNHVVGQVVSFSADIP